jgi:actin-related protein
MHTFKYGRYGTETASTVVIGDAESVSTKVYRLLFSYQVPGTLFVTTLLFIAFRQGKSQPSRTRLHGLSGPTEGERSIANERLSN